MFILHYPFAKTSCFFFNKMYNGFLTTSCLINKFLRDYLRNGQSVFIKSGLLWHDTIRQLFFVDIGHTNCEVTNLQRRIDQSVLNF